jgi:putative hydrolase of the HAD superfamily
MNKRYVLWDFDGTLARRPGNWGSAIQEAARSYRISRSIEWERVVPLLSYGLPWHEPATPHLHLSSPQLWWEHVENVIALKFAALNYEEIDLLPLAKLTREIYVDPKRWEAMDGAPEVLASVASAGWTNIVVTNHVPEVADILQSLKLGDYVTKIFCSAGLGLEKPHPDFFPRVLVSLGPYRDVCVVGDSEAADIIPARVLGLRTILVGGSSALANVSVTRLSEIPAILISHKLSTS